MTIRGRTRSSSSCSPLAQRTNARYGAKPALFIEGREIAHLEAPGVIDLRITRQGWSQARDDYGGDLAVRRAPSRRDWIELHLRSPADLGPPGPAADDSGG